MEMILLSAPPADGRHCSLFAASIARYASPILPKLNADGEALAAIGVLVVAVSTDSEAQTRSTAEAAKVMFPLLCGMDEAIMNQLGFYVFMSALLLVDPQGI